MRLWGLSSYVVAHTAEPQRKSYFGGILNAPPRRTTLPLR